MSAPLFMTVEDGIRCHLVGAGITNKDDTLAGFERNNISTGRPGVEAHVLEELASISIYEDAINCLEQYQYFPVYDAGVERLIMTISNPATSGDKFSQDSNLPADFDPATYAATYRTDNSGIAALLGHILAQTAKSLYGRYL